MRDASSSIQDCSSPPACGRELSPVSPPRRSARTRGEKTSLMIPASARLVTLALLTATLLVSSPAEASDGDPLGDLAWVWPAIPARVVRPFVAPAHMYGPGHRGLDLAGDSVRSPADGRVAFVGAVAGRDIVTIDHGDGLVTTLEPVVTDLDVGAVVARASPVGRVAAGGHAGPATVHFGVRWNGEYVNPLRLLGGVPRAVLLPCCER